ncbi:MAG: hypothetical protein BWY74_03188 [Firmicutes bacterium ADurb.Bin419]|nr:MAG: hypothetical protein BWY74_03188 [Firmicutes bacterium ADurb.Bin419]
MQFIPLIISLLFICFLEILSFYCFANASLRLGGNLPGDLKWILEKAASLDSFIILTITIVIMSLGLVSITNHISNHVILSLDILFFFNSLIVVLFNIIKQMGFAPGK